MPHRRTPQPFTLDDPLDYEDARVAAKEVNLRRTTARDDLEKTVQRLVDAERDYRKGRARKHGEAEGTVGQREAWVDKETADLRHARDGLQWQVKIIQERLAELDGQRASLHRLIEWSAALDPRVAEVWAQRKDGR